MKGYKASDNGKCSKLQYEVGKTYSISKIKICEYGFHFCEKMEHVLEYYPYNKNFVLFEIEALGKTIIEGNKFVTGKINIVRIVPKEEYTFEVPLMEYDERNNCVHVKHSNGYEEWNEYDKRNNCIHERYSSGREFWKKYDKKNNLIHYKDSFGYEKWNEYDERGNLIHEKYSNGDEKWNEYDERGNLISYKDNNHIQWRITIED
jgi:YD repeat-containing protein